MFTVRLAELNIEIENKHEYIYRMCSDYLTSEAADFCISASEEEISAECTGEIQDRGYLESLAVYRKIAEKILDFNGFLMHGVAIDVNGWGVAFLAKSGVGKSTHAKLWAEVFKDKITVINGDKPLIRITDNKIFAYGSPWAGKEKLHANGKTELKKICFIERSDTNECLSMNKGEVLKRLINQVYIPKDKTSLCLILEYIEKLIQNCEFYLIKCNTDISAAKIAYKGIGL